MKNPAATHQFFEQVLFQATGRELEVKQMHPVAGGCIHQAVMLETEIGRFFLKYNEQTDAEQFIAEAAGLQLLRQAGKLPVPEVIGQGVIADKPYLVLPYLESAVPTKTYWEDFGRKLADLHRNSQENFGLATDNFIGRLPQRNTPENNWATFFIEHRLEVQLQLALYNHHIDAAYVQRFRSLYPSLQDFFPNEPPALLHGDLWSGNVHTGPEGAAWLIDPAVYYGHREMELAFTELFGGFAPEFYTAYRESWPLESGYRERVAIYNLYPLLVHVNLFGTSYLSGIDRTLKRFV